MEKNQEQVREAFYQQQYLGELKISNYVVAVGVTVLLFAFLTIPVNRYLGCVLILMATGYTSYFLAVWLKLRTGWYQPYIRYVSSTLEVSAATIIMLNDAAFVSPQYTLTSSPFACAAGVPYR